MKKLLFVFILSFIYQFSNAQIEKGNFQIDSRFALNRTSADAQAETSFSLSNEVGYLITNNLLVGVGILHTTNVDRSSNFYGINSLLSYYFSRTEKHAWFITNRFSLVEKELGIETGLGFAWSLSPSIVLENILSHNYYEPQNGSSFSNQLLRSSLRFFLNRTVKTEEGKWTPPFSKGDWMIGGSSAGFTRSSDLLSFYVTPNLGLFLNNRLVLGGQFQVNVLASDTPFRSISSTLSITPFFRYYYSPTDATLIGFLEGGAGLQHRGFKAGDYTQSSNHALYFAAIGLDVMLAPTIAFEVKGLYDAIGSNLSRAGLALGFQFFLK